MGGLAASAQNPGQAMEALSNQMTQMAGRPTVAWEDFQIMMQQAPAGMAQVAASMGTDMGGLIAKIQDGSLKTTDFITAIQTVGNQDSFQKLATQPKTISDALDGLMEGIQNALLPLFNQVSAVAIPIIGSIGDAISAINFDNVSASATNMFAMLASIVQPSLFQIQNLFSSVWGFIQQIIGGIDFSAFSGALSYVGIIVSNVIGVINQMAIAVSSFLAPIISSIINTFSMLASSLGPVINQVVIAINQFWQMINSGGTLKSIGQIIGQVFQVVGSIFGTVAGVIGNVLVVAIRVLTGVFGAIKPVIDGIVGVFKILMNIIQGVWNILKPVINGISGAIGTIGKLIGLGSSEIGVSLVADPTSYQNSIAMARAAIAGMGMTVNNAQSAAGNGSTTNTSTVNNNSFRMQFTNNGEMNGRQVARQLQAELIKDWNK
jgi:tape measure domain-containing protein